MDVALGGNVGRSVGKWHDIASLIARGPRIFCERANGEFVRRLFISIR